MSVHDRAFHWQWSRLAGLLKRGAAALASSKLLSNRLSRWGQRHCPGQSRDQLLIRDSDSPRSVETKMNQIKVRSSWMEYQWSSYLKWVLEKHRIISWKNQTFNQVYRLLILSFLNNLKNWIKIVGVCSIKFSTWKWMGLRIEKYHVHVHDSELFSCQGSLSVRGDLCKQEWRWIVTCGLITVELRKLSRDKSGLSTNIKRCKRFHTCLSLMHSHNCALIFKVSNGLRVQPSRKGSLYVEHLSKRMHLFGLRLLHHITYAARLMNAQNENCWLL